MINFKAKDFKDVLYDIYNIKDYNAEISALFPSLKRYPEFEIYSQDSSINEVQVFKYIVAAYDQKSPYFLNIEDLIQRKKESALFAGFKPNGSNLFNTSVREMLNCENKDINAMIIRYCRMQGKDFTNLIASNEAFYQINIQLITNINGDIEDDPVAIATKKAALDKAADEFSERLSNKARKFLSQETSQHLHDDLWSLADEESIKFNIKPEDYAI